VSFKANDTLCMAAVKQGLLVPPGRSYAGDLSSIDIGIKNIPEIVPDWVPKIVNENFYAENLPVRPDEGHKGTFGTCMVIAGSPSYTGAAYLAGKAAYRSGCGLVHMVSLDRVQQALAGKLVEAVWTILPGKKGAYDPAGINLLNESFEKVDAIVIGPGWGIGECNLLFLERLLERLPQQIPTLFDADSLKLLGSIDEWWKRIPEKSVLTPHPGELSVLSGLPIHVIQSDRWHNTRQFAMDWGVTILLKGAVPVISTPDGQLLINPVSDSILATAGSGDVLSGVIGGFLAQGLSVLKAVALGTCIQAKTARLLRRKSVEGSATALDILETMTFI
jgi:NAD(P)H-hydrate epimerase